MPVGGKLAVNLRGFAVMNTVQCNGAAVRLVELRMLARTDVKACPVDDRALGYQHVASRCHVAE